MGSACCRQVTILPRPDEQGHKRGARTTLAVGVSKAVVDLDTYEDGTRLHWELRPSSPNGEQEEEFRDGGVSVALLMASCCCASVAMLLLAAAIVTGWAGMIGGKPRSEPSVDVARAMQHSRLRIKNGCPSEPMWLAFYTGTGKQLADAQNVFIESGAVHDVQIPDEGFEDGGSARWWSKWRCVASGNSCAIGDSGGPGQVCDGAAGCAPPVDTKISAKFGDVRQPCNRSAGLLSGCDFVDVSVQDGFTVPFQLNILGECTSARPHRDAGRLLDCRKLSIDNCPPVEDLGAFGKGMDLRVVNPAWGSIAGCASPCSSLSYKSWSAITRSASRWARSYAIGSAIAPYCCPSQHACEDGKLSSTRYVEAIREMCPSLNAYHYDQGAGWGACPAGTMYEMTFFCPAHAPGAQGMIAS